MFIDFFLLLKYAGIKVTLKEYLTFLDGLSKNVCDFSLENFYFFSKTALIKREKDYDKFDMIFGKFFEGVEEIEDSLAEEIPEEWLKKNSEKFLTPEEMEKIKAYGNLDELMERMKELMEEQKERHEGGNKWIGTGGTSPFGAYGYNPQGFRIGQDGSRHRRAIKVWDKREFQDLSTENALDNRNMKMALRYLRKITRTGKSEELDLESTIRETSKNAGNLKLMMQPPRDNNVKVLLLMDIGGSMDDHIELCRSLFAAAQYEFKHLEYFYFHNCPYEFLWKDNKRRWTDKFPTKRLLNTFNSDYKLIFIGDASMSPYELLYKGGAVEYMNSETGVKWMSRILKHFEDAVWINPVPQEEWHYTQSIQIVQKLMNDRMFPLTLKGIEKAVKAVK